MTIENVVLQNKTQTLTHKTININTTDGNVITGIGVDNFAQPGTSEAGKCFVVNSEGKIVLDKVTAASSFVKVAELPSTGASTTTLYYLTAAAGTYTVGLYVWDGSVWAAAEHASTSSVDVDGVTIGKTSDNKLQVLDGNTEGTTGLTTAKFNVNAIATTISASGSLNTKVATEKAVADALASKITLDTTTTGAITDVKVLVTKDATSGEYSIQFVLPD